MMTQETLREAVARAIAETEGFDPAMDHIEGWYETADAAIASMFERLLDPATVHVTMLRGGIAKPSPANIWHIYGRELLAAMPKEYAAEEEAKLFERLRTPSEGMIKAAAEREDQQAGGPITHEDCWQAMLAAFQQENSDER